MLLFPVPSDLTGEPRLEEMLRQADAPHRPALLRTRSSGGLQLQQRWRNKNTDGESAELRRA